MGFLFLAVYAAESQVLLVSALLPIFVAALAVVSVSISILHEHEISELNLLAHPVRFPERLLDVGRGVLPKDSEYALFLEGFVSLVRILVVSLGSTILMISCEQDGLSNIYFHPARQLGPSRSQFHLCR
jgi:hypothetical protein